VARRAAGGPTKSELIRSYKKSHGGAGPTEIAAALSKDGSKVSPQFVSTVLSNDRRKGRKRRRAKAAGNDSVQTLVLAKKLADQMGGIDQARTALNALARILG
jgi:hypothetical protein